MPLHLLKLSVGATSVAHHSERVASRLAQCRALRQPAEHLHPTRMVPKRIDDILAGGSMFWVIKGQVAARQRLLDIRPFTDEAGVGRCHLVLDPEVVAVLPRPCRPFQGWRYLADDVRPPDLGSLEGASAMPEHLRFTLRELCLL